MLWTTYSESVGVSCFSESQEKLASFILMTSSSSPGNGKCKQQQQHHKLTTAHPLQLGSNQSCSGPIQCSVGIYPVSSQIHWPVRNTLHDIIFGPDWPDKQYVPYPPTHLQETGDNHWKHGEWEAQDIEEGDGNKCPVSSQSLIRVVFIGKSVSGKGSQGNLNRVKYC